MLPPRSVAIIGGGPAGAALGTHLVRAGCRVAIFRAPQRPKMLIGESLIPAVVTCLRELGVEEQIKSFSTYKPGATFYFSAVDEIQFDFGFGAADAPSYAYNTPRDLFDKAILDNAEREGVTVFPFMAEVEFDPVSQGARLSDASMARAQGFFESQPDFVVDATGRSRMFSKALNIPFREGKRKDAAMFAHIDNVHVPHAGHIHLNRLGRGWSWRIPLPGRTSVGMVAPKEWVETFGSNTTDQYDAILRTSSVMKEFIQGARITEVTKYSNYQLISEQMYGPNWALVGDAAGFIDPIFSSGLLLSFTSAKSLSEVLLGAGDLEFYQRRHKRHLRAWQRMVDIFYDGRFLGLVRIGRHPEYVQQYGPAVEGLGLHLTRILTGVAPFHPDTQRIVTRSVRKWLPAKSEYRLRIL